MFGVNLVCCPNVQIVAGDIDNITGYHQIIPGSKHCLFTSIKIIRGGVIEESTLRQVQKRTRNSRVIK